MNEDDTFKRLKSLTMEEALEVYRQVYFEAFESMTRDGIDTSNGIPLFLLKHEINERLKPYGLDWDTVFPYVAGDFS